MPAAQGGPRLNDIARRWRDLADRRLAYFTELYQSGRWKHYYTQERFALRMLDVIRAAKVWGEIADRPRVYPASDGRNPAQGGRMRPAA